MKHKKMVSVIIPCYNQASYLSETLDSLLCQTYQNWEGIIVNDGSPDNTEEIAKLYVEKDKRFRYVEKENGGLSSARNAGINQAVGEYILPLDSDDRIADVYIERAIAVFEKNPDITLVYCRASYFGMKTGEWNECRYIDYKDLLLGNRIFCSSIFRKDDCLRIGGYDENMKLGFEDWEFYIRLLNETSVVYLIPEFLFFYRVKENSLITITSQNTAKIESYIYSKNYQAYLRLFGSGIDVLRLLNYYKCKEQKRKRRWWYLVFNYFKKNL